MAALSRLATAIDDGALTLPEGDIAVFRPGAGVDLAPLPREAVHIVQGFAPDAAAWQGRGYAVEREPPAGANSALVCVPRSKDFAKALIAQAAALVPGGLIVVDGQKTDGVDSLMKAVRARLPVEGLSKAHGRLFWFRATESFADWAAESPAPTPAGHLTLPGVFSEGGVDAGSALLAELLPEALPGRVVDLGAGWGFLALAALSRAGVTTIDLVEAEARALECARLNVTDARARFHWADATCWAPEGPVDHVICTPPFHTGRAGTPELGLAFIDAAARMLGPKGSLWLVANRQLPYEAHLRARFRSGEELTGTARFKIFHASRPAR